MTIKEQLIHEIETVSDEVIEEVFDGDVAVCDLILRVREINTHGGCHIGEAQA